MDDQLKRVLSYLRKDLAAIKDTGADPAFISAYKRLLDGVPKVLGREPEDRRTTKRPREPAIPNLPTMSLDQLEGLLSDQDTPRSVLERVATEYFSVPAGSIRTYRTKAALARKIHTMIEGRKVHMSIERLAAKEQR